MSERPSAPETPAGIAHPSNRGAAILGVILVVVGIAFFVGQYFDLAWGDIGWPLYVIVPGLVMLVFGLSQSHAPGLTIAGTIVTSVGLVLFYQNATDHWESWAYAWALVGPAASGLGMVLHGLRFGNGKLVREGFWPIVTGVALFAVGFIFFEGVIGLSGDRWNLAEWVMPVIVIGLGVLILGRALLSRGAEDEPAG